MARNRPQMPAGEFNPDPRDVDQRGPTNERMASLRGQWEVGDTGTITVRQNPIERGVRRGLFTVAQGQAALKFYGHWWRSGVGLELASPDFGRVGGGGVSSFAPTRSEDRAFHWDRLGKAVRVVRERMAAAGHNGGDATRALYYVVCQDMPFETCGRQLGYVGRDKGSTVALILVNCSLNILVAEWGL